MPVVLEYLDWCWCSRHTRCLGIGVPGVLLEGGVVNCWRCHAEELAKEAAAEANSGEVAPCDTGE